MKKGAEEESTVRGDFCQRGRSGTDYMGYLSERRNTKAHVRICAYFCTCGCCGSHHQMLVQCFGDREIEHWSVVAMAKADNRVWTPCRPQTCSWDCKRLYCTERKERKLICKIETCFFVGLLFLLNKGD